MYAYILCKVETDIYIYAHIGTQARAYVHTYIFLYFPFTTFVQRIITSVEGVRRDWGKSYARRKRKGKVEKEKNMRKKNTATVSPTISIGDYGFRVRERHDPSSFTNGNASSFLRLLLDFTVASSFLPLVAVVIPHRVPRGNTGRRSILYPDLSLARHSAVRQTCGVVTDDRVSVFRLDSGRRSRFKKQVATSR